MCISNHRLNVLIFSWTDDEKQEQLRSGVDKSLNVSDAFLIELYALREDLDPRTAFYLLEAAFEVYPMLNYCLMSMPTTTRTFPLLKHFVVSQLIYILVYCGPQQFINDIFYSA